MGDLPRDPEALIRLLLDSLAEHRWMFWNLLVLGLIGVLLSTVLYRPYVRLWEQMAEGELGRPVREQNPKFGEMLARYRQVVAKPRLRWSTLVVATLMLAAGLTGLLLT